MAASTPPGRPAAGDQQDLSGVTALIEVRGIEPLGVQAPLPDRLRAWWLPRRVIAMVLLTSVILALLLSSAAADQAFMLLAVVSVGAALTLTSFVPVPGQRLSDVLRSPCATVGGVVPLACAASVLATPSSGSAFIALFFLGFALMQRFGGTSACST